MKHLAAWLLILTPLDAQAVEFEAGIGPTIHQRCHMDYCGFATINTALPVAERRDGTLFAISAVGWGANYNPNAFGQDEYANRPVRVDPKKPYAFMVFCSKTRPYAFDYYEGHWQATALKPGDDKAVSGATESVYQNYWAACHHFFPKSPFDPLVHKLAAKLGYHFEGGADTDGLINQPSDLLK